MADFSVYVTIINNTKEILYKKGATAEHGDWIHIPNEIGSQARIQFQLKDRVGFFGSQGTFKYSIGQAGTTCATYETCPLGDPNVVKIKSPPIPKAIYIVPFRGSVDNRTWTENGVPKNGHPVYVEFTFDYEKKRQYRFRLVRMVAKTDHPVRNSRNELVRPNNSRKVWESTNDSDWIDSNKGSFQPNVFQYDFNKDVSSCFTVTIQALDPELIGAECFLYGNIGAERVFQSGFFLIKAINTDIPVEVNVTKPKSSSKPFVWNADVEWGMELRISRRGVRCVGPKISRLEFYWVAKSLHRAFQNGIPIGFLRNVLPRASSTVVSEPHTLETSWKQDQTDRVFYHNNKIYDTIAGAAAFGVWSWGGIFNESYYLAADGSGVTGTLYRHVNCMDQAAMLQLAMDLGPEPKTSWLVQKPFGYINKTRLVGIVGQNSQFIDVNNPFFGTDCSRAYMADVNDLRRTAFGMHVYNGDSKPFQVQSDGIYDACGGPQRGTEDANGYLNTSIDTTTTLYGATIPNTYPGTPATIMEGDGVTGVDGAHWQPTTAMESVPEAYRKPVSNLLSLSAMDSPSNSVSYLRWAYVPEWIKHVLDDGWDTAFGQVSAGNSTAHAFWHLRCAEDNGIHLRVNVHVETLAGSDRVLDVSRSALAVRDRLTLILMSTDRNPEDLWVPGTLTDFGQYSLQYANHIAAGRIIVASGNVLVDISGAPSTAALESYARRLLEHTIIRDYPSLRMMAVRCPSLETSEYADERRIGDGPARAVVNGVNTEFSLHFELNSSVAAANADVEGAGILVDDHIIQDDAPNGSVVIFTFVSQDLGTHTVNVHFADSLTLISATKKVEVIVVDNEHGGGD